MPNEQLFLAITWWQVTLWEDDDVCYGLDQHAQLDFYETFRGKHVTPLQHINLILSQVFDLTVYPDPEPRLWSYCMMLRAYWRISKY